MPGATGPSRRTLAYQRASSGRTLWLIRAIRPSTNQCDCVAHGAANSVSSSSGPAPSPLIVFAPAQLEPVAVPEPGPVDAEQRQVLAVAAGERLVPVGPHPFDRLLRVQADRGRRAAVDVGLVVAVAVKAERSDDRAVDRRLRHAAPVEVYRTRRRRPARARSSGGLPT